MKDGQASLTAYTVLQGILHVSKNSDYHYLIDNEVREIGEKILSNSVEGLKRIRQLDSWWYRLTVRLKERIMLPGISLHYVLRKSHIELIVRQLIACDVTQIVMLGAGFDTLLWRIHLHNPHINCIEIDHPATQAHKLQALQETKGSHLHFLSIDFSQQKITEVLTQDQGFDPQRKTLFICEGVMMYLSAENVDDIFDAIRQLTGHGSELIFSALEPQYSQKNSVPSLLYWYLNRINEPILWELDSYAMSVYLSERHCRLKSMAGRDEMLQAQCCDELQNKLHQGEYLVHCVFD